MAPLIITMKSENLILEPDQPDPVRHLSPDQILARVRKAHGFLAAKMITRNKIWWRFRVRFL
jgi:hypothetical protein